MVRKRRFRVAAAIMAVAGGMLIGASPVQADCVTAGAWVHIGATKRTVVPSGTCVVSTPLPAGISYSNYYGEPSTAGAGVQLGVPFPP